MNEPASFVHGSVNGCPDSKYDQPLAYHPRKNACPTSEALLTFDSINLNLFSS